MRPTSDSGYAANAGNLRGFYMVCGTYDRFNPGLPSQTVAAMEALTLKIEENAENLHGAKGNLEDKESERRTEYKAMQKTLSYVGATLRRMQKKDPEKVEDILNNILRAKPAAPPPRKTKAPDAKAQTAAGKEKSDEKKRAVESRGFANQLKYLHAVIDGLEQFDLYKPGDAALKITALKTMATTLKKLNEAVVSAETTVNKFINERHTLLRADDDSLLNVVGAVKDHVKHVYGQNSNEYKQLVKFKFVG